MTWIVVAASKAAEPPVMVKTLDVLSVKLAGVMAGCLALNKLQLAEVSKPLVVAEAVGMAATAAMALPAAS